MSPKIYIPTEELYSVTPKQLSDMSYLEALQKKLKGIQKNKKALADEWLEAVRAGFNYDVVSQINSTLDYMSKAENLINIQIAEVLAKDFLDKGITPTKKIYGILPFTLRWLPYKEALLKKLKGVTICIKREQEIAKDMYATKEPYEVISLKNHYIDFLIKAKKLTEFQLEELKEVI